MTKLQKIGLWIGGLVFLIFEILWGVLLNAVTSFFTSARVNLIKDKQVFLDNPSLAYLIILVEIFTVFVILKIGPKFIQTKLIRFVSFACLYLILFSLAFILYLNFAMDRIAF